MLEKSDYFGTRLVPGWRVDILFHQNDFIADELAHRTDRTRASSSVRHVLEHALQRALDHRHVLGRDALGGRRLEPVRERNDAGDEAAALPGKLDHHLPVRGLR